MPKKIDAHDEAGDHQDHDREPGVEHRDRELHEHEPTPTDRPHEEVAQVAPVGLSCDRVPAEQRDDDDEQQRARDSQRERGQDQARLRRQVQEAALAPSVGWVELDRHRHDHGDEDQEPERDVRAQAPEVLDQLGAQHRDGEHQNASTSPRNASSSRRRAVTVSTAIPARTSAATSSERRPPSIVTEMPGASSSTRRTMGSASSTRLAVVDVVDLEVHGTGGPDELVDRPGGDQLPLVHDHRVRADLLHLGEDVAREQHRRAGFRHPAHELAHLAHLTGVEPVGRLVEHEHLGPAEQHAREPEPLPHALRVRLHLAVDGGAEIGDGQRRVDVGVGPLVAAGLPPQAQVARPGEVGHERGGLDEGADPSQLIGAGTDPFTEDPRLPTRGPDETEEHAQARGLARAVRAEQAADLPAFDAEREVVDRRARPRRSASRAR